MNFINILTIIIIWVGIMDDFYNSAIFQILYQKHILL